jgi:asparagine synthase (glutamine-hydrolysing)
MCGIAGLVGRARPRDEARELVSRMVARMHHRGPDDRGLHVGERVVLGMARLSIIDLAGGHQPLYGEDRGVVAVQNGEIYNFRALRAELEALGHVFATASDTECIVHGYEAWGDEVVTHLRGMFALAVWDEARQRLFVARDRLGEKPLFYTERGGELAFASELGCLRELGHPFGVCERALDEYLSFGFIAAPRTIHPEVKKLEPGHFLVWQGGRVETRRYWAPPTQPSRRPTRELLHELREVLDDAVKTQLVSDAPLGAFLSGGIDSTAVVALMTKHSPRPVETFCVGFGDDPEHDERPHARAIARHLGTVHHEAVIEPRVADDLPRLVASFDEPFSDKSLVPTYYVAKMAREHVTVSVSGDGGDEVFAGYVSYVGALSRRRRLPFAAPLVTRLASLVPALPGTWRLRKRALSPDERFLAGSLVFDPDDKARLYRPEVLARVPWADPLAPRRAALAEGAGLSRLARMQRLDLAAYLPDDVLTKVDRMTMRCSLESRAPLLDHRLVELGLALPDDEKLALEPTLVTKRALRSVAYEHVPRALLDRPKRGFSLPVRRLLRGELAPLYRDVLASRGLRELGLFSPRELSRYRSSELSTEREGKRAWSLLCLGLFAEQLGG